MEELDQIPNDCDYNIKNIKISINKGLKLSKKIKTKKIKIINPYDFGNTSNKIISILKMKKTYENLKYKKFYDV